MWFLQADTLLGIGLICLLMMCMVRVPGLNPKRPLQVLSLLCVLFIGWVSLWLLAAYLLYIGVLFTCARILFQAGRGKRAVLLLGVFLSIFPLAFLRLWPGGEGIIVIGLAFSVLRAIDALCYVYYAEEKIRPQTFFLYMLFVPTFTAGPVFRHRDFARALTRLEPVSAAVFMEAVKRMIRGFFKVTVVSAVFLQIFSHFTGEGIYTLPVSLLLVVCSYWILYFNLSGYADIAIALGRLCGFTVPENFKKPWRAASFTQFWRSWHATVSDWIREHVFLVLHKKALTRFQSACAVMVVMLLMALWHGFAPLTILLGLYLGGLLAIENLLGLTSPKKKWTVIRILRCFAVNFLFAINSLQFLTDLQGFRAIVTGFFAL